MQEHNTNEDLIERLRKRAEIRRQILTRKSVQENKPDRIADLLEEAAITLENKMIKSNTKEQDAKTMSVNEYCEKHKATPAELAEYEKLCENAYDEKGTTMNESNINNKFTLINAYLTQMELGEDNTDDLCQVLPKLRSTLNMLQSDVEDIFIVSESHKDEATLIADLNERRFYRSKDK